MRGRHGADDRRGWRAAARALSLFAVAGVVLVPFTLAQDSVPEQAEQSEQAELEKLRGAPRLLGELDQLEVYGELTHMAPARFDELLEKSGANTMVPLLELLSGLEVSESTPLTQSRMQMLDEVLGVYPDWVVSELGGDAASTPNDHRRVIAALAVLESRGGANDLSTARELVDPRDPEQRPDRTLLRAYESALTAALNRDQRAVRVLEDAWSDWPENLWTSTVKAVGGAGSPAALDLLVWLLQDAEGSHEFLVQQIGRVAEASRLPGDFGLHSMLIDYAGGQGAGLRREACVTLGKLQCSEAVQVLISRLDDPHAGVRAAAFWSLQAITGKNMKPEPSRWYSWYAGEERWWRDEFHELRDQLDNEDPAVVGVAIRELGRRKLRRHELAEELLPLLDDEREGVVCMTIAGLGALGSAVAVEPLTGRLDSDSEQVRELALRALSSITGRDDLPAERRSWADPWRRN
jgi:HEAT repeat protein